VNAASASAGIAPGSLITIYGVNLSNGVAAASSVPLPLSLGGTSVSINDAAAPLIFVSPGQINAQVPVEILPGPATLVIRAGGVESAPVAFSLMAVAPGLWNLGTGSVRVGDYVSVFGTGSGVLDSIPVTASVGGQAALVSFAGMAPGLVGVFQVNLVVPPVGMGTWDLAVAVGGTVSNPVRITVE
jgi:uncharacterized protein (TIGR03437 family)